MNRPSIMLLNRSVARVLITGLAVASLVLAASPASASLVRTTGNVVVLPSPPRSVEVDQLASNDHGFVFGERTCSVLAAPLPVDVLNPAGTYSDTKVQPGTIPTGTEVDSHLVHLDEVTNAGTSVNGSMTFDRPVLGLIFLTQTLNNSDPLVGAPGTIYPMGTTTSRGYELASDSVQVSADRRTVTFSSSVGTPGFQDDLRIITAGTCGGPPSTPPGKDKVVICHKPGTPDAKTMEAPRTALSGHLGHGDSQGPCGPVGPVDADADGFNSDVDCNDSNPAIHPGAKDIVNDGIDQNCDGADLVDADRDTYPSIHDCNDLDPSINPAAVDIPGDGIDQNCSGGDAVPLDADADGFNSHVDCNDDNGSIHPGATDIPGDGIDQDCDGSDSALGTGQFVLTSGQTATLSSTVFGACNAVTYGYQRSGGSFQGIGQKGFGCTQGMEPDFTIGPFDRDVVFSIVLVDHTCGATFDSTGNHASVTGSNPYSVRITDAGLSCEYEGTPRVPGPNFGQPPGNLITTLTIN